MQSNHSFFNSSVNIDYSKPSETGPTFLPTPTAESTTAVTLVSNDSAPLRATHLPIMANMAHNHTEAKSYSQRLSTQIHTHEETPEQQQHQQLLHSEDMVTEITPNHTDRPFPSSVDFNNTSMKTGPLSVDASPYSPSKHAPSSEPSTPATVPWAASGLLSQDVPSAQSPDQQSRRCKYPASTADFRPTYTDHGGVTKARENFTPEQLTFLRQLYSSGVTRTSCHLEIQAAANQLNISYDRVKNWINNNNKRIRQLAVKEKKRSMSDTPGSAWLSDTRQTGHSSSPVNDRAAYSTGSGSGPNFPVNVMSSLPSSTAAPEAILMSSNDSNPLPSQVLNSHSENADDSMSIASPFSSKSKRARTESTEQFSQRPSQSDTSFSYSDIDLLVMSQDDDVIGAFPIPSHTNTISVVQSCIELFGSVLPQRFVIARTHPQTKKHVLLLASQLDEPASIHLRHGVIIFIDIAHQNVIDTTSNGLAYAQLEQINHGQVRCIGNKSASNSPIRHCSATPDNSLKQQQQHFMHSGLEDRSQKNSPIDSDHSPSHSYESRSNKPLDTADMAILIDGDE